MIRLNLVLAALLSSWFSGFLLASPVDASLVQQPTTEEKTQTEEATEDEIVATVEGRNIMLSQVQKHAERTVGDRKLSAEQLKAVQEISLAYFVNREIVSNKLKLDSTVGENQIRIEVDLLTAELESVGQTLEDHLTSNHRTRDILENGFRWKLGWNGFLERQVTEEKLQDFFESKRRQFDGTQIKVAQILFPIDESSDQSESIALANQVREQLSAGEVTWTTAVEKHSIAPSKENGGSIGWIGFLEPMPQQFTKAAFALDAGQIGQPFASQFGVHLVKVLEIKPGTRDFGDARDEVTSAVEKYLFQYLADQHRDALSINYADGWQPAKQESN